MVETRYADNEGVSIAFQVIGDGDVDLSVNTWLGGLEVTLEQPLFASFVERLASFSRVIRHDRRATGLSDRSETLPNLETQVADLREVFRVAQSSSAALLGMGGGLGVAVMYAATYPERARALILYGGSPRGARADDYPWGFTEVGIADWSRRARNGWGSEKYAAEWLENDTPSKSTDPGFVHWFAKCQRHWVTPGSAAALWRQWYESDLRDVMRSLRVPTLVLARDWPDRQEDEYTASLIPGAEFLRLPGRDGMPWVGDTDAVVDAIQTFLGARRMPVASESVLATILFTDIVGSTGRAAQLGDRKWKQLVARHDDLVRQAVVRYRGRELDHAGDGFLIAFDGPARAIRCACAIADSVRPVGLEVRAGVHTGECEVDDEKLRGIAVHIGARVSEMAQPDEVLVSSTVKDLVAGSGFTFAERGSHALKGVPGEWRLWSVERR